METLLNMQAWYDAHAMRQRDNAGWAACARGSRRVHWSRELEVDDMEKTADYLRTKGVDIVRGPRVRETYSRAEICDPNGYHIELRQWFR
jgi:hypothetical protein